MLYAFNNARHYNTYRDSNRTRGSARYLGSIRGLADLRPTTGLLTELITYETLVIKLMIPVSPKIRLESWMPARDTLIAQLENIKNLMVPITSRIVLVIQPKSAKSLGIQLGIQNVRLVQLETLDPPEVQLPTYTYP